MTILFPYQRNAIRGIEKFNGRCLLSLEMGLGKTLCSLYWSANFLDDRPTIAVVPAAIKWQWQREARIHCGWNALVLDGMRPEKQATPDRKRKLYIVNYDILRPWMPFLLSLNAGLIIVDECQFARSQKAQRTKQLRILCRPAENIIALSGTPIVNRPAELWPILNILRPDLFPRFPPFGERFCSPTWTIWGPKYTGATNLKELNELLTKTCMIRYRKADVLSHLPAKIRSVIPMELDNRKEYLEAQRNFLQWLRKVAPNKVRRAAKAEKLAKMGYLKRLAGRLKLQNAIQWIKDRLDETGEKMIVFAVHKAVLSELEDHFAGRCVKVDGSVTGRERQKAFDQFNRNKRTKLFLGNIQAAGVGWSCNSASTVVFVELGWTPGEHVQAEDRIHGVKRGQEGITASAIYLVARGTIEEYLAEILQQKQTILSRTLDGSRTEEDLSIYDQLEKALLESDLLQ